MSQKYAFILGREADLSLAELIARYGEKKLHSADAKIAIFELDNFEKYELYQLGGSIRVVRIIKEITLQEFRNSVVEHVQKKCQAKLEESPKIHFAIGAYGLDFAQFEQGMVVKKLLHQAGIPARLVNHKNDNIASALFKEEKLGKTEMEYVILSLRGENFLGVTLACQDIDSYTRRDIGKTRDMDIGMLPPKLAQIMINIANFDTSNSMNLGVYDPFIGLGTIAIEAMNMGKRETLGSDLNADMVVIARKNGEQFLKDEKSWQEKIRSRGNTPTKDSENMQFHVFSLDARHIGDAFPEEENINDYTIVSEGYLGEIMRKEEISLDKIRSEQRKLALLYGDFFRGLGKMKFRNTIVMTFPFWNMRETAYFFTELDLILKECNVETIPLLPSHLGKSTSRGTLLHKRPGQQVGREVWRGRFRDFHEGNAEEIRDARHDSGELDSIKRS